MDVLYPRCCGLDVGGWPTLWCSIFSSRSDCGAPLLRFCKGGYDAADTIGLPCLQPSSHRVREMLNCREPAIYTFDRWSLHLRRHWV
jgi:hypothetical protein